MASIVANDEAVAPSRPRILIPEKVSADGLALLSDKFDIDQPQEVNPTTLLEIIPQYAALIVRSETRVTAEVLSAGKNLKVVARAGVGVDNIDINSATEHGIIVVNSPSGNIAAAAEHTIALLMAVARNIPAGDRSLRTGHWARSKLVGTEVGGKTLGVIGLGKVGFKVARMAMGLGMKVLAMDPYASPEIARTNSITLTEDLKSLLPAVDFLTIHTPLIASTMDLISTDEFALMKPSAKILNVARGGVYNEQALFEALESGIIAGAALDVFTSEPPKKDSWAEKLTQQPKVVVTPHLGASTVEAQENVSIDVCNQVLSILSGGLPTSAVNAPIILPEVYRKLQPFVKLIERMGGLYTQHFSAKSRAVGSASLGGKTFELIYEGELADMANTKPLFAALVKGLVGSISEGGGRDVNMVNANLIAKEKGILINETRAGLSNELAYASLVTLKAVDSTGGSTQIISGYVSGRNIYISRLDRFDTNFVPEGRLLVLHNYDQPGKIGGVGSILGRAGINIRFMAVAGLGRDDGSPAGQRKALQSPEAETLTLGESTQNAQLSDDAREALMILGVDGAVSKDIEMELRNYVGIMDVSIVEL